MPDISKLSDLSEILSISISDLLGSEDKSSISVEKVIEKEDLEISELIDVAPIVPPKTIEETVKEKKSKVKVDELVALAPFLSSKALSELVEDLEVEDVSSLVALAPFLEEETLSRLLNKHEITDSSDLVCFQEEFYAVTIYFRTFRFRKINISIPACDRGIHAFSGT